MSQWTIRTASQSEAPKLASICFEAYKLGRDWSTLCPNVKSEDWIEVQTDLCLQHFHSEDDLVLVAEDNSGEVIGVIYGRSVGKGLPGVAKRKPLEGRNMTAVKSRSNAGFVYAMTDKYGKIFCKFFLLHDCLNRQRTTTGSLTYFVMNFRGPRFRSIARQAA